MGEEKKLEQKCEHKTSYRNTSKAKTKFCRILSWNSEVLWMFTILFCLIASTNI